MLLKKQHALGAFIERLIPRLEDIGEDAVSAFALKCRDCGSP
jgi:hypothetical protein